MGLSGAISVCRAVAARAATFLKLFLATVRLINISVILGILGFMCAHALHVQELNSKQA